MACEGLDKDVETLLMILSWVDHYRRTSECSDKFMDSKNPEGEKAWEELIACGKTIDALQEEFETRLAAHVKKMVLLLERGRYGWCCAPKLRRFVSLVLKLNEKGLWPGSDRTFHWLFTPLDRLYLRLLASAQIAVEEADSDFAHC